MIEDHQLLHEYTANRSETAFGELVSRHIDLVFSAALRLANGDRPLAQDVTQTVFTDLARKAHELPPGVVLPGWLYRHACFTTSKAIRTERRRQAREQIAMEMNALENQPEPGWDRIAPQLEEAMSILSDGDRDALVLRFFKRQDFRAVGQTLGISEDAAQKRVSRALEKLRGILDGRGVGLTATTLGTVLIAEAVTAAPAGLALSATSAALAAAAGGAGVTYSLIKLMTMTKLQWALIAGLAIAAATIPVIQSKSLDRLRRENDALRRQTNDLAQLREDNERLAKLQADKNEMARLRKLQPELLRLRAQVTALRNRNQALASKPASVRQPAGDYIPAARFGDAGLGSPEAALQTFLSAGMNGNTNRMQEATDFGTMKKLMHDKMKELDPNFDSNAPNNAPSDNFSLNEVRGTPENFAGFQLLSEQFDSTNQAELQFAVTSNDGSAETNEVTMNQIDGQWKVDPISLVDPAGTNFTINTTLTQPDGTQTTNNFKLKTQQTKQQTLVPAN